VLVLGGEDQKELIVELKQLDLMVFTDHPNIADTIYVGDRPTSPVYFLQLMVRYGLVWGQITPDDDHELGQLQQQGRQSLDQLLLAFLGELIPYG
jgi:hypothetical protein